MQCSSGLIRAMSFSLYLRAPERRKRLSLPRAMCLAFPAAIHVSSWLATGIATAVLTGISAPLGNLQWCPCQNNALNMTSAEWGIRRSFAGMRARQRCSVHPAAQKSTRKLTAWHAGTMFKHSVLVAATAAAAFLQPALASETQLQTSRVVEPEQRSEFPLTGKRSAFKYSYSEDVRPPPRLLLLPRMLWP